MASAVGKLESRMICTALRQLSGQYSTGPMGVAPQSNSRKRCIISPRDGAAAGVFQAESASESLSSTSLIRVETTFRVELIRCVTPLDRPAPDTKENNPDTAPAKHALERERAWHPLCAALWHWHPHI